MPKNLFNTSEIISNYRIHDTDSGSPFVQVALLSGKIAYIAEHLQKHKNDNAARYGLICLVSKRNKFMKYIKKNFADQYVNLANKLGIRLRKADKLL